MRWRRSSRAAAAESSGVSRACLWHGKELLSAEQINDLDRHYGAGNVSSMREWALKKFAELHDGFALVDKKRAASPTLTLPKFEKFMSYFGLKGGKSHDVARLLFNAIDVDGDGGVDFDEFFRWILTMRHGTVNDKVSFGFRLVDVNRDGDVEKYELKEVLIVMFSSLTAMGLAPPSNIGSTIEAILTAFPDGAPITLSDYRRFCLDETTPISMSSASAAQVRGPDGAATPSDTGSLFGQEKWEFMLSVMIAIHTAVSSSAASGGVVDAAGPAGGKGDDPGAGPAQIDYPLPAEDAKSGATHVVGTIRSYNPALWRQVRTALGVGDAMLLQSLGFEQVVGSLMLGDLAALSGHVSEGRRGSFFFSSGNGKFMVKTVSAAESKSLRSMTPDLAAHVSRCPETLLAPICGHFKLKQHLAKGAPMAKVAAGAGGAAALASPRRASSLFGRSRRRAASDATGTGLVNHVYFVVMQNVFAVPPIERFDLKGSTRHRGISEEERANADVVRKDNDFVELRGAVGVGAAVVRFRQVLLADVSVLRKHGIVDYSALIGVLPREGVLGAARGGAGGGARGAGATGAARSDAMSPDDEAAVLRLVESIGRPRRGAGTALCSHRVSLPCGDGGGQSESEERGVDRGGRLLVGEEFYQIAIIDYLVPFDQRKNAEFALKRTIYGAGGSVMPPEGYADRFEAFLADAVRFCAVPSDGALRGAMAAEGGWSGAAAPVAAGGGAAVPAAGSATGGATTAPPAGASPSPRPRSAKPKRAPPALPVAASAPAAASSATPTASQSVSPAEATHLGGKAPVPAAVM